MRFLLALVAFTLCVGTIPAAMSDLSKEIVFSGCQDDPDYPGWCYYHFKHPKGAVIKYWVRVDGIDVYTRWILPDGQRFRQGLVKSSQR